MTPYRTPAPADAPPARWTLNPQVRKVVPSVVGSFLGLAFGNAVQGKFRMAAFDVLMPVLITSILFAFGLRRVRTDPR